MPLLAASSAVRLGLGLLGDDGFEEWSGPFDEPDGFGDGFILGFEQAAGVATKQRTEDAGGADADEAGWCWGATAQRAVQDHDEVVCRAAARKRCLLSCDDTGCAILVVWRVAATSECTRSDSRFLLGVMRVR